MDFERLFVSEQRPYQGKSRRDKYLSRIFGIFNEEIIRVWCRSPHSPFEDLGRPTIYDNDGKHYTLDFLLKDEASNLYITEMKCEIEYQKYRYLTLESSQQIAHHRGKRAFQLLLEAAHDPAKHTIKVKGEPVSVQGSALVWGRVTEQGANDTKGTFGLSHIISTESAINDLIQWKDPDYIALVSQYRHWSDGLFGALLGVSQTAI